jgi:hypothetical protein
LFCSKAAEVTTFVGVWPWLGCCSKRGIASLDRRTLGFWVQQRRSKRKRRKWKIRRGKKKERKRKRDMWGNA